MEIKVLEKLMREDEAIDYSAVIVRLAGQALTDEQKEMCARYDALYDATHGDMGRLEDSHE